MSGLGVPLGEAIAAATLIPARALHIDGIGSFTPGHVGDAVLWDDELRVRAVWQDGVQLTRSPR